MARGTRACRPARWRSEPGCLRRSETAQEVRHVKRCEPVEVVHQVLAVPERVGLLRARRRAGSSGRRSADRASTPRRTTPTGTLPTSTRASAARPHTPACANPTSPRGPRSIDRSRRDGSERVGSRNVLCGDETVPPVFEDRDGVGVEIDAPSAGAGRHGALDGASHGGLGGPGDRHTRGGWNHSTLTPREVPPLLA